MGIGLPDEIGILILASPFIVGGIGLGVSPAIFLVWKGSEYRREHRLPDLWTWTLGCGFMCIPAATVAWALGVMLIWFIIGVAGMVAGALWIGTSAICIPAGLALLAWKLSKRKHSDNVQKQHHHRGGNG